MPWIIATTLTVFVPLVLIYLYVSRRLVSAVVAVKGWDRKSVRNVALGVVSYINLFPLLFLVVFLIGGRTRIPAFSGESFAVDLLFVYPFWFGLVITIQLFLVLLLMDGSRLVVRLISPASSSTTDSSRPLTSVWNSFRQG